ncbi:NAD-dependent epimerase/dehydratase family protein [Niabella hibiscisoli]|uniref:NAD-dependent epimerase/dehydratase family protein n=1 Tax=Niabella hibiscisoli TaxID=1825928 RepID=UPI001F0DB24D|nr:NAD-dependent epimerase/dehydratase family protein [Niabella hibiscisoli]MCH5720150.1 NAD-dependent epimerase/dehydratase family protein [Niabella hibiscisoli]
MKIIITGATGMVGEGVLLECLSNPMVTEVLIINRKHYDITHSKLKELIVKDFTEIGNYPDTLKQYDGCFFCAAPVR